MNNSKFNEQWMNNSKFNYHVGALRRGRRPIAYYKLATPRRLLGTPPSVPLVVCGHCETYANHIDYRGREKRVRVCRTCGYALRIGSGPAGLTAARRT